MYGASVTSIPICVMLFFMYCTRVPTALKYPELVRLWYPHSGHVVRQEGVVNGRRRENGRFRRTWPNTANATSSNSEWCSLIGVILRVEAEDSGEEEEKGYKMVYRSI